MTMTFDGDARAGHRAPPRIASAVPRGLPAPLPRGEKLLWQGSPRRDAFARRVFRDRLVIGWFALAGVWQATIAPEGEALGRIAFVALSALATLAILHALAWLVERTTVYTVTSARTVMRIGVALPKTIDIPHGIVEGVDLRERADGRGDIALDLGAHSKVAYALLWPHAQPWHLRDPRPMLRGVPDAARIGALIARGAADAVTPADQTTPAPEDGYELRDEHANPAPRRMVLAVVALVAFTLAITGYAALTRPDRIDAHYGTPVETVPLAFVDTGPGAFDIVGEGGGIVASVANGREGLLRNARRAFETRRRRNAVPLDAPYELTLWDTDRLTLHDPLTGQNVRLDFFGRPPEGPLKVLHGLVER